MEKTQIFTRVYSRSSAGQLVSGKGPRGYPLDWPTLADEFRLHADIYNRQPTALVSVSRRIVDTVGRAFSKHYDDGELPADIWIVFIEIPSTADRQKTVVAPYHHARSLARLSGVFRHEFFEYEFVFEWAIPEIYVQHKVSLQTLMDRGLGRDKHSLIKSPLHLRFPRTYELRLYIAKELQIDKKSSILSWEVGIQLGHFAQHFGARAPTGWIAHQLLEDCLPHPLESGDDDDVCQGLDEGIDLVLIDQWLTSDDFIFANDEFEHVREILEDPLMYFPERYNARKCAKVQAGIEAIAVAIGL